MTLITSHNMSEVEELADRVVFLVDGNLRFSHTVSEIRELTGEQRLPEGPCLVDGRRSSVIKVMKYVIYDVLRSKMVVITRRSCSSCAARSIISATIPHRLW